MRPLWEPTARKFGRRTPPVSKSGQISMSLVFKGCAQRLLLSADGVQQKCGDRFRQAAPTSQTEQPAGRSEQKRQPFRCDWSHMTAYRDRKDQRRVHSINFDRGADEWLEALVSRLAAIGYARGGRSEIVR